jgi:3-hydroxyacyl-[acyl-carrier-protein] dehydratase
MISKVANSRAVATRDNPSVLEIEDLLRVLPHRYPFLLVDRVIDIRGDESAIGIKNVTVNEPFFAGHFPERPVMPGVLLVEGMAQTGGAVCAWTQGKQDKPLQVMLITVDKAKFRRPVRPGQVIEYHVRKLTRRRNMWWFRGEARVAGHVAAEAEIGALLAEI